MPHDNLIEYQEKQLYTVKSKLSLIGLAGALLSSINHLGMIGVDLGRSALNILKAILLPLRAIGVAQAALNIIEAIFISDEPKARRRVKIIHSIVVIALAITSLCFPPMSLAASFLGIVTAPWFLGVGLWFLYKEKGDLNVARKELEHCKETGEGDYQACLKEFKKRRNIYEARKEGLIFISGSYLLGSILTTIALIGLAASPAGPFLLAAAFACFLVPTLIGLSKVGPPLLKSLYHAIVGHESEPKDHHHDNDHDKGMKNTKDLFKKFAVKLHLTHAAPEKDQHNEKEKQDNTVYSTMFKEKNISASPGQHKPSEAEKLEEMKNSLIAQGV